MPPLRRLLLAVILTGMISHPSASMELNELLNLQDKEISWKEFKGDHFIIFYDQDDQFAKGVLEKAEEYYKKIADELGYERYSNFWQWDHRVKIYVYPSRDMFLQHTGQENWSSGAASYKEKEIWTYNWGEGFLEDLLPHEITHLIFRDYVGFKGEIPLWLDEGVAQWQESSKRGVVARLMKSVLQEGKAYSLKELTESDIRHVKDGARVTIFYMEAISLVSYLVNEQGRDNFIAFCRQLRDGKSLDEALRFTYPTTIRNLDDLEEAWKKFVLKKA